MNNKIVLRQQQKDYILCNGEDIPVSIATQWKYVPPTQDMESRGLTSTVLREIVDGINAKSKEHFVANFPQKGCKGKIRWIQLGVLSLGIFIVVDANLTHILSAPVCYQCYGSDCYALHSCEQPPMFWIGVGIAGFTVFWWLFSCMRRMNQIVQNATGYIPTMQEHVENELNEQWQPKNIRWAVTIEDVVRGYEQRNNYNPNLQRYHIEVTSMLPQNIQMVQIPMRQVGGQQMVMQQVGGQQVMMQPMGGQQVMGQQQGVCYVVMGQQVNGHNPGTQVQTVTVTAPQDESQAPPAYDALSGDASTTVI